VLLLVCAPVGLRQGYAQEQEQEPSPIHITVRAGFDSHYRVSQWYPVEVVIQNDGPDVRGVLEWRSTARNDDEHVFQRNVDLPRGSHKRITFNAFTGSFVRLMEVRVRSGNTVLLAHQVAMEPIGGDQTVVGVVSSDNTLLRSLAGVELLGANATSVLHLEPEMLPEQARVLDILDVLFLHDNATLSEAQRDALAMWVHMGGTLVVSGGASADQSTAGLDDLLPVTLEGLRPEVALDSLATLVRIGRARSQVDDLPATTASKVRLRTGADDLDGNALVVAQQRGVGRVVFTAFDLGVLRAWGGEAEMWKNVLRLQARFVPSAQDSWSGASIINNALQLPSLKLPSLGVLFLFVLGYIVIIGPVNFLVLRKLKRAELAWITVPVLVVLFVLGTYGASFLIRGTRPEVVQLSVVQSFEGYEQAQVTGYVGVFSPRRREYTLRFPGAPLVRGVRRFDSSSRELPVLWNDSATELPDVLIDVSSLRTFVVDQTIAQAPTLQSTLERTFGRVQGEIINTSNTTLHDAIVVHGSDMQQIGTIAPGQTLAVQIEPRDIAFPVAVPMDTEDDLFNRAEVISSLFGYNKRDFTLPLPQGFEDEGMVDRHGVYVLGWDDSVLVDVEVEGATIKHQGQVLHMIRLADG
jgi:hypothetical protein